MKIDISSFIDRSHASRPEEREDFIASKILGQISGLKVIGDFEIAIASVFAGKDGARFNLVQISNNGFVIIINSEITWG